MKLRHKLLAFSLSQIFVFAALFVTAGIFMRTIIVPRLHEQLVEKTSSVVRTIIEDIDVPLATVDTKDLRRRLERHGTKADFLGLVVVNNQGRRVHVLGRPIDLHDLQRRVAPFATEETQSYVAEWAPVSFEGVALGSVAVAFDKTRLNAVGKGVVALSVVGLLAILTAIGFSLRFSRHFVQPIGTMIEFSRQVAAGEFTQRLHEPTEAELGELQRHLNDMTSALQARDVALGQRQTEIVSSMDQLRRAQEELMNSARLAAVGEIAGHTAHEVLNPITGIHGRVTRALEMEERVSRSNRGALRAIVDAWGQAYREGGMTALSAALSKPTSTQAGPRPIVEEDLEVLAKLMKHLEKQAEDDTRDWRFLLTEVDRITHIVDNMRSLNRRVSTPAYMQVRDVLNEILEICSHGAAKRNIKLVVEGDDARIYVDRHEVVQVLSNLARNGMQAIEEKSGRVGGTIVLRSDPGSNGVAIRIRDDGAGVDPAQAAHLFEAGFTTRGARDGTGLGLSLSRRLARGFGGRLVLESSGVGEGSTFLLEIPQAPLTARSSQTGLDAA